MKSVLCLTKKETHNESKTESDSESKTVEN